MYNRKFALLIWQIKNILLKTFLYHIIAFQINLTVRYYPKSAIFKSIQKTTF